MKRTLPFVELPNAKTLFAKRAQRFTDLAIINLTKEDLPFFANFCDAQQQSAIKFKDFAFPLYRFGTPSSPPFNRSKLLFLGFYESVVEDFLKQMSTCILPTTKREALAYAQQQKDQWRPWGHDLLNHTLPQQQPTYYYLFIAGVLQIIYSLTASQLIPHTLIPQKNNLCPACGGTHSASVIATSHGSNEEARFCSCLYCGTLWRYAQARCTFCASAQSTSSYNIGKSSGNILAETCDACKRYCIQLNQHKEPSLNVFADDIDTLTLDCLPHTLPHFKHGNFNPFLKGNP
ncbi:formate dehydrogenase accessory protein FdhE [Bartonella australis AUST/NH1]|uniref:Formate dehydrogenase accessory protein FdhE n=1 Tax=Bartonella australis (strain Aust/NH1) TaxID=1094489 RepID=M1NUK3_BARAA|nr:formate dehydrogenase accessory protein FdhE [Bartonella australis]AGF74948.1 formate dehydrogenase accessory protein FdhE [Bartonella australis AUST/NH1]